MAKTNDLLKVNNLIKAVNYNFSHSLFCVVAMIIITVIEIFAVISASRSESGGLAAIELLERNSMYMLYIIAFIGGFICGSDIKDKTINYEVLVGHNRGNIFFSRAISCVMWCMGIIIAVSVIPTAFLTITLGWGHNIDFGWFLVRCLVSLFPYFAMVCGTIFLTFVTKSVVGPAFLGALIIEFQMIALVINPEQYSWIHAFFPTAAVGKLYTYENYSLGFVNGEDIPVFECEAPVPWLVLVIAASLVYSAVLLVLAKEYFRKADIN